jgi:hypothetical protein
VTVEIRRRGMIRAITDLPSTADATTGHVEVEQSGAFYSIPIGSVGGGDPALAPLGTEEAAYTSEFTSAPSGWTWLNQGTSTVSYALSRAIITPQAGGAGTNALRLFGPPTFPAAPWTVRVRMLNWSTLAGAGGGIAAYRSSNGRIHTPNVYERVDMSTGLVFSETWAVNDWSAFGTINATRYGPNTQDTRSRDRYLQMRCDGTSLFFDYSVDNAYFTNITSTTLATYLGGEPDRVMMIGNNPTATAGAGVIGYDWFRVYANANLNQV